MKYKIVWSQLFRQERNANSQKLASSRDHMLTIQRPRECCTERKVDAHEELFGDSIVVRSTKGIGNLFATKKRHGPYCPQIRSHIPSMVFGDLDNMAPANFTKVLTARIEIEITSNMTCISPVPLTLGAGSPLSPTMSSRAVSLQCLRALQ